MKKVTLNLHRIPEGNTTNFNNCMPTLPGTPVIRTLPAPSPSSSNGAQWLSREEANVRATAAAENSAHGGEGSQAWPQERARTAPRECGTLLRF